MAYQEDLGKTMGEKKTFANEAGRSRTPSLRTKVMRYEPKKSQGKGKRGHKRGCQRGNDEKRSAMERL